MQIFIDRSRAGFFANFNDVIRRVSTLSENEKWHVYWGPQCSYFDSQRGPNVWEYFFENKWPLEAGQQRGDVPDLVKPSNMNFRQASNYHINKNIVLKPHVQKLRDVICTNINKYNTLGVHLRKTDKFIGPQLFGEPQSSIPLSDEIYVKYIDYLLVQHDYEKIFLATDDLNTLAHFKEIYGNKLIYTDSFRSSGTQSIHHNHFDISGYKKGLDVLMDCFCLSNCKFLVRSSSNVSSTSLFLNLDIKQINLNEIINGDNREQQMDLFSENIIL